MWQTNDYQECEIDDEITNKFSYKKFHPREGEIKFEIKCWTDNKDEQIKFLAQLFIITGK